MQANPTFVRCGDLLTLTLGDSRFHLRAVADGSVWVDKRAEVHGTALFEVLENLTGGDER
jgi:hypothetical protein